MKYLILALLPAFAFAAPAPLTFQQEVGLYNAITALDSGGTKNVDGKSTPFSFEFSGATRATLARDLVAVTPAANALSKVQVQRTLEISGGKPVDPNDAVTNAKINAAITAEFEKVDPNAPTLITISSADLRLDTNPISFKIQALLAPIIAP